MVRADRQVYELKNLQSGFWKVWRNAGSAGTDGQSVRSFEAKEEQELQQLAEELRTESDRPASQTGLDTQTREPGKAATWDMIVRDRVVQAALRNVIEPIFASSSGLRRTELRLSSWPRKPRGPQTSRRAAEGGQLLGGRCRYQRLFRQHPAQQADGKWSHGNWKRVGGNSRGNSARRSVSPLLANR